MLFSEPVFLFVFLPATLAAYFAFGLSVRNAVLLAASLLFYAWGEEKHIVVLLASIVANFTIGLMIGRMQGPARLIWLWIGIAANLGLLGYFKYTGFLLETLGLEDANGWAPVLPIGISFFTFQALSYLIDLYHRRIDVQRNPARLALYIALFPQLIAGPIVRYIEVESALARRRVTRADIGEGMARFVRGLAKKTLIADPLGLVADRIFAMPDAGLSPETAWLGVTAYSLQLFFDFSGYSDMAIGLGRILGFRFPENFDYPYISRSVTEFWRRWHMTLSRWFRDYLYIPLGGNRRGAVRTCLNLAIVFLATGLWHGAAWTFVVWGLFHGAFLILERAGFGRVLALLPAALRHGYLLLVVLVGWTAFRSEDFGQLGTFLKSMFAGAEGALAAHHPVDRYLDAYGVTVMIVAIALSMPLRRWIQDRWGTAPGRRVPGAAFGTAVLFAVALISVGAASYSPFIYFRF